MQGKISVISNILFPSSNHTVPALSCSYPPRSTSKTKIPSPKQTIP